MKNAFKIIGLQILLISFGILLGNGMIALISGCLGDEYTYSIYFPFAIIITAVCTALPTLIFYIKKGPYILKIIIHFIILLGVVMFAAYVFDWAREFKDFLPVLLVFIPIYIAVWVVSYIKHKNDEKQINTALINNIDED